jgi:hypothetical protein
MHDFKYEGLNMEGMPVNIIVYNGGYACKYEGLTMTCMTVNMKV